jgi:hypothetical protein
MEYAYEEETDSSDENDEFEELVQEELKKDVLAEFEVEEAQRQKYANVLRDLEDKESGSQVSYEKIGEKYGMPGMSIWRVSQGKSRMDGERAGRRPLISEAGEARVVRLCQKLQATSVLVHTPELRNIARIVWRHENLNTDMDEPKFSSHWVKAFKERHPQIDFCRVRPQDRRRFDASNRSNVNEALQSVKNAIRKNADLPGDFIMGDRVFFADETDVTMNNESAGTKAYEFGGKKEITVPAPKTDSPHISATGFVNLAAQIASIVFVVAGKPSTCASRVPRPENLIFNTSGSSEVDDSSGRKGSWRLILECFVRDVKKKMPKEAFPLLLIVDRLAAHVQESNRKYLAENGIKLVVLHGNLTHLIQLQDTSVLFGFMKGRLRRALLEFNLANGGMRQPLEAQCFEVEKHFIAAHTKERVHLAARSIGFELSVDGAGATTARMTDESISQFLDHLMNTGKLHGNNGEKNGMELRNRRFMKLRKRIALTDETTLGVFPESEAAFIAQEQEAQIMIDSRVGVARSRSERRVSVAQTGQMQDNTRPGTSYQNAADAAQAREKRSANKKKMIARKKRKRTAKSTAKASIQRRTKLKEASKSKSEQLFYDPYSHA